MNYSHHVKLLAPTGAALLMLYSYLILVLFGFGTTTTTTASFLSASSRISSSSHGRRPVITVNHPHVVAVVGHVGSSTTKLDGHMLFGDNKPKQQPNNQQPQQQRRRRTTPWRERYLVMRPPSEVLESTRFFATSVFNRRNEEYSNDIEQTQQSPMVEIVVEDDDDDSNQGNPFALWNDPKFGIGQRMASIQSLVVGGFSGSLAMAFPALIHDALLTDVASTTSGLAQFEFDSDAAAVMAGLFAIVYRYCLRMDGDRDQLKQGVTGAFAVTRTLSRITVPASCKAIPLYCGAPLGYLNWNLLSQLVMNGLESLILFGAAAAAMDYCMEKKWISKFPG